MVISSSIICCWIIIWLYVSVCFIILYGTKLILEDCIWFSLHNIDFTNYKFPIFLQVRYSKILYIKRAKVKSKISDSKYLQKTVH
jgi:hypothetical protein